LTGRRTRACNRNSRLQLLRQNVCSQQSNRPIHTAPGHDKTVYLYRVVWGESARPPDKCVQRRSASGGRTGSACGAGHSPTVNALVGRSGRLISHRHTTIHDKAVLSVSCLVCRCELDDCSESVQTSDFLSATVVSCRESSSHRRCRHDADRTVLSCVAWRCELALRRW